MKKLTVALALGLASSSVFALGLGQIKVTSGLNEPLRAEIPVLSSSPSELRGLKVELASADDFARVGLSLAQVDVPLQFTVVKKHGDTVIEITTKKAVSDPALDFLVEVNWANGKLLREYTILLDPPNMAPVVATPPPAAPAQTTAPEAPGETDHAAVKQAATAAAPAPVKTGRETTTASAAPSKPASVTQTPAAPAHAGNRISVNKGDTLWKIAQDTHADAGVDINEMMLALHRTNPGAFYKDNINALKSGAVLRMPSRDELAELSPGAARAAVRKQNRHWANVQPQAPVMVTKTGSTTSSSANRDTGSRSTSERLALVPPTKGGDDVASDPGVAGGTGSARITGLKRQLSNAKTALTSAKQQSEDLQGRVDDLEGINSKNAHLISLKDAEIAELQRKLAAAQKDEAVAATAASAAAPGAAASVQSDIFDANAPASSDVADTTALPAGGATVAGSTSPASGTTVAGGAATALTAASSVSDTSASSAAETSASAPTAAESTPASVTEMPAANTPVTPEASVSPWYMQDWVKYLAGLVILLLIVLGFMKSRGKKAAPAPASGDAVATAYQGDVDEENALLEEIHERPDDLASHMELASLYYAQRDQDKFEAAAEAMHPHVDDPHSEEWQQVRAMGEELCPDSPLFVGMAGDDEHAGAPEVAAAEDESGHDASLEGTGDTPRPAADDGYSFDFDLTPEASAASTSSATDAHEPAAGQPATDAATTEDDSSDDGLGFGITSETPVDTGEAQDLPETLDTEDMADDAVSGSDHQVDEETAHGSFSSDPVDTKLDLARAYQDMGDAEGARAMLDEVLAEGSEAQKDTARKLIDELG